MSAVLSQPIGSINDLIASHREGYSLPAAFYRSQSIYDRELDRIFATEWLYAGHISRIPDVGDYFLYEVAGESVIIVRDEQAEVRAFANVCRHRGSKVCLEPCGKAKRFVCRYHGWAYGLDGALANRRYMHEGFDPNQYGLKPVQILVYHGMIFVNLTQSPERFAKVLSVMDKQLEPFAIGRTKIAARRDYEVEANWKLAVENFLECYHCSPSHPEYARTHSRVVPDEELAEMQAQLDAKASCCGLVPGEVLEREAFYHRHALKDGYASGTEDGKPAAPLLGSLTDFDCGASDISMGTLNYGLIYSDHVVIYAFKPTDVQRCNMEITWLVRDDAVEGRDYDVERLIWLWDVTTEADKRIITNNQVGVNSRFYEPGPLSEMEPWLPHFMQWYFEVIAE